ncbi:MAG: hypothetical protein MUP21_06030 [Dehalococcoidia bacterium]|nr:hypothetical protein [Dehalococcoidia bacterium]
MDSGKPRLRLIAGSADTDPNGALTLPGLGMLLHSEAQQCCEGGIDVLYFERVHISRTDGKEFRTTKDPNTVELLRVRLHVNLNILERILGIKLRWKVRLRMWALKQSLLRKDREVLRNDAVAQSINRSQT